MDGKIVLALNCGSSSLKFGLYRSDGQIAELLCEGEAEEIGGGQPRFWFTSYQAGASGQKEEVPRPAIPDHVSALTLALDALRDSGAPPPEAVGHRFVHGGPGIREHQRWTPELAVPLRDAVRYAPLHLPAAMAVLEAMQQRRPDIPQVICLDTAFHRNLPLVSKTFPLPDEITNCGIQRYGFHGLSLESIMEQLHPMPERVVVAHLGNGASITAVRKGVSIDTTMGLTPTGGVMMGTRCGDLDPGVIVYLMRHGYADPDALENLLDHRSGLLGVSGTTSDVRQLLSVRRQDARADLALRLFCYQVRKAIAGLAAALEGLDAIVFTGGIGEHATELRSEICSGLAFLGVSSDSDGQRGAVRLLVLPSQEDRQIAKTTAKLI